MTKAEKSVVIKRLTLELNENKNIYLTDASGLNSIETSKLRRACFKSNIKLSVVKNTLLEKAMISSQKEFLIKYGIEMRLQALKTNASQNDKEILDKQVFRLTASQQMGELFKVLELIAIPTKKQISGALNQV